MRILLVEDEPGTAAMHSKGLREESYAVDAASDGERALESTFLRASLPRRQSAFALGILGRRRGRQRSIEYDERLGVFRVITGAGPNAEELDFKLWGWDGDGARPALREAGRFDRRLKPEGVTRVRSEGRDFTFIVFDTSGYAAAD
ncbi:MAG TPA: hypothetical protein VEQ42_04570 [Pyrinomonadaceae bacterium]|nr:hypothetical protein [Pyrinomonadaceae bacterium]